MSAPGLRCFKSGPLPSKKNTGALIGTADGPLCSRTLSTCSGFAVCFRPVEPSPCKPIANPRKITRRVFCVHYNLCLDLAVTSKREGFSCGSCGSYLEVDRTRAAHWQAQAESCGRLLKAILVDQPKKGPGDYRPRRLPPMTHDELAEIWRQLHPDEPVPERLSRWRGV